MRFCLFYLAVLPFNGASCLQELRHGGMWEDGARRVYVLFGLRILAGAGYLGSVGRRIVRPSELRTTSRKDSFASNHRPSIFRREQSQHTQRPKLCMASFLN